MCICEHWARRGRLVVCDGIFVFFLVERIEWRLVRHRAGEGQGHSHYYAPGCLEKRHITPHWLLSVPGVANSESGFRRVQGRGRIPDGEEIRSEVIQTGASHDGQDTDAKPLVTRPWKVKVNRNWLQSSQIAGSRYGDQAENTCLRGGG